MKISTRNQLKGKISAIERGVVNSEVIISLSNTSEITAIITNGAVKNLSLKTGDEAIALVKASHVILGTDVKQVSARNVFCGKISEVIAGAVNSEISIDIGNGLVITSIITKQSADKLDIQTGKEACAIIKASTVIIAVE